MQDELHIAFLYSDPLVHWNGQPIESLAFHAERRLFFDCLNEARKAVNVRFEVATTENLRNIVTKGTRVLHYSGHSTPEKALAFENGRGSVHKAFSVEKLRTLFSAGGHLSSSRSTTPTPFSQNSSFPNSPQLQSFQNSRNFPQNVHNSSLSPRHSNTQAPATGDAHSFSSASHAYSPHTAHSSYSSQTLPAAGDEVGALPLHAPRASRRALSSASTSSFSSHGSASGNASAPTSSPASAADVSPGVQFVFVAACNSEVVGKAFFAAGVPHVVAVQCSPDVTAGNGGAGPSPMLSSPVLRTPAGTGGGSANGAASSTSSPPPAGTGSNFAGLVTDRASRVFAHSVYLALLRGISVGKAFEIGRAAVHSDPNVLSSLDADKFLLLSNNLDYVVFPEAHIERGLWSDLTPLLHVRLPSIPECFMGRHVEMHSIIDSVLSRRLTIVRGAPGIGKTAIAVAVAHYLSARRHFHAVYADVSRCVTIPQLCAEILKATGSPYYRHFTEIDERDHRQVRRQPTSSDASSSAPSERDPLSVIDERDSGGDFSMDDAQLIGSGNHGAYPGTGLGGHSAYSGASSSSSSYRMTHNAMFSTLRHALRTFVEHGLAGGELCLPLPMGSGRTESNMNSKRGRSESYSSEHPANRRRTSSLSGGASSGIASSVSSQGPPMPDMGCSTPILSSSHAVTNDNRHFGAGRDLLLVVDGLSDQEGSGILTRRREELREFLSNLLSECGFVTVMLTSRRSIGRIEHIRAQVRILGALKPAASVRLFLSMSPRKCVSVPLSQNTGDIASRFPLLAHLGGNPRAIALATSLLEERSFQEVERLITQGSHALQLPDDDFPHTSAPATGSGSQSGGLPASLRNASREEIMELKETLSMIEFFAAYTAKKSNRSRMAEATAERGESGDFHLGKDATQSSSLDMSMSQRASGVLEINTKNQLASFVTETVYRRISRVTEFEEADAFRSLAVVTLELGNVKSSLDHLTEALALYRSINDQTNEADTLQLRVGLKIEIELIDKHCSADLESAMKIYESLDDTTGQAWCMKLGAELKLLEVSRRRGKEATMSRSVLPGETSEEKPGVDTSSDVSQARHKASSLQTQALRDARSQVDTAYEMFNDLKDDIGVASSLRVRARLNLQRGNLLPARQDLELALEKFSQTDNQLGTARTLLLLGSLKYQLSDYRNAVSDLRGALDRYKRFKHQRGQAKCLRSLGDIYFKRFGETDKAVACLKQALRIFEKHDLPREQALALRTLGDINLHVGNLDDGQDLLQRSLLLFARANYAKAHDDTAFRLRQRFSKDGAIARGGARLREGGEELLTSLLTSLSALTEKFLEDGSVEVEVSYRSLFFVLLSIVIAMFFFSRVS